MRMPLGVEQGKTLLTRVTLVVASAAATFDFMPTSAAAPTGQGEQRQVAATQDSHETVDLYGKQVDRDVAENLKKYAQENNLDLEAEFKEKPVTQDPNAIEEDRGGVEVPDGYVYDPSRGALHDYCTNSPDQFPAPGVNADFSGACAIHDMCYEKDYGNADAMVACDTAFLKNLRTVCKAVYTSALDPRLSGCLNTADTYYKAVVAVHPKNYFR